MDSADNKGCVKQAVAGLLALLMAPWGAFAEGKFLSVLLLTFLFIFPQRSTALDIQLEFDANGQDAVNPCNPVELAACGHTAELMQIVESAASHLESIIKDDHTITLKYWWLDPSQGAPDALIIQRDGDGKPIEARIRISADLGYYYDPFPDFDSEFLMRPKLARTVPDDEAVEAFVGGFVPEVYEVAYNGKEIDPMDQDLLTTVLHEMLHALGISSDVSTACDESDDPPFYLLNPGFDGVSNFKVKAYEFIKDDETKFDCAHLALGGIASCKPAGQQDKKVGEIFDDPSTIEGLTVGECASHQALNWQGRYPKSRARPSINGILVMQEGGNWEDIDLPRLYSLTSGNWYDADIWLGEEVPNNTDDVFIVNQLPMFFVTEVNVTSNQSTKSVYISDENKLTISGAELDVMGPVTVAGPNSTTGPLRPIIPPDGGEPPIIIEGPFTTVEVEPVGVLSAFDLNVEDGARFLMNYNGEANLGNLENVGVVRGEGLVNVFVMNNRRKITAEGGELIFSVPEGDPDDTVVIGPPELDLDGPGFTGDPEAVMTAVDGDLIFDGPIADSVHAGLTIGEGHFIDFVEGWTQGFSGNGFPKHVLKLNGGLGGATVHGESELSGKVEVNGNGIFTSPVTFIFTSETDLDIGGVIPGSEYDQLSMEQHVEFNGKLMLEFVDGFTPSFGDNYVLMTYPSHTGEFSSVQGVELNAGLGGGIKLFLEYNDTDLSLFVGFDGGTPGEPNCNGQTTLEQAGIHGGIAAAAAFHGFGSVKEFTEALENFCEG